MFMIGQRVKVVKELEVRFKNEDTGVTVGYIPEGETGEIFDVYSDPVHDMIYGVKFDRGAVAYVRLNVAKEKLEIKEV